MTTVEPLVGEVAGYRAFEVRLGRLWSVGYGPYEWIPGTNTARCDRVGGRSTSRTIWVNDPGSPTGIVREREIESAHGRIPSPFCSCGFWFYKGEATCREHFPQLKAPFGTNQYGDFGTRHTDWVMGRVKAWGQLIEGTDGYRAEFAKVDVLVTTDPERFATVLDHYQLETVAPRSKGEEGLSTAWVVQHTPGDPTRVVLDHPDPSNVDDEIGTFAVERGLRVPPVGSLVTVRFEPRVADRWITSFHVHREEGH